MFKKYVLVVDDDILFLKSIKRAFKFKDFETLTALSGKNAMAICNNYDISVVISDYKMPDMDGLVFLKKIRMMNPHIILIMITAFQDINVACAAINEIGIFKFILKPIDYDILEKIVDRAIEFFDGNLLDDKNYYSNNAKDVVMNDLESKFPGITVTPPKDKDGYILLDV